MRAFDVNLVQQLVDRFWHLRQPVRVRPIDDDFLFQCSNEDDALDLDLKGWVHLKGSLVVLQRVRGYSVLKELSLNLGELWVKVEGLPLQHSSVEVATSIMSHVGDVMGVDTATAPGSPVTCPRVKVLVNMLLPLIPVCYFPTYDNHVTWVQFKYEGIFRFCKKCGFVGHGPTTCRMPPLAGSALLERRFRKFEGRGFRVLYGPTNVPIYSNALRGIFPSPSIWTITVWYHNHQEENNGELMMIFQMGLVSHRHHLRLIILFQGCFRQLHELVSGGNRISSLEPVLGP